VMLHHQLQVFWYRLAFLVHCLYDEFPHWHFLFKGSATHNCRLHTHNTAIIYPWLLKKTCITISSHHFKTFPNAPKKDFLLHCNPHIRTQLGEGQLVQPPQAAEWATNQIFKI
jgi:hypothetical protein